MADETRERPEAQIILFGSCAKGLRTKESDIDLLAITDDRNGGAPEAYEERRDDETGCRIEVVVRHRSTVEEKRTWAAAVVNASGFTVLRAYHSVDGAG